MNIWKASFEYINRDEDHPEWRVGMEHFYHSAEAAQKCAKTWRDDPTIPLAVIGFEYPNLQYIETEVSVNQVTVRY